MTLEQAKQTAMPFGMHAGVPLEMIAENDPTYLSEFLAEKKDTLVAWLREALELVLEDMKKAPGEDPAQGELFGDQQGQQSTGENRR